MINVTISAHLERIAGQLLATGNYDSPAKLYMMLSELFCDEIDRLQQTEPDFTNPLAIFTKAAENIAAHFDLPPQTQAIH